MGDISCLFLGPKCQPGGLLLFLGWGDLQGWEQGCDTGHLSRQTHSLELTWTSASITGGRFLGEQPMCHPQMMEQAGRGQV